MNPYALPAGAILNSGQSSYKIVRVLGSGGFGITYLATSRQKVGNITVPIQFAIKEHFMSDLCERDSDTMKIKTGPGRQTFENSMKDFLGEARRLQKIGNGSSNVVKVNEVFEANGTAYYVMEFLDGESLRSYVQSHGPLSETETMALLHPVVETVDYLHSQRMTHLDIKPDNIMLARDEDPYGRPMLRPVLIDFGLSKHYDANGHATSTVNTLGCSDGYAPMEQYAGITTFSPSADIYALAATILFCLTGKDPRRSTEMLSVNIPAYLAAITPPISPELTSLLTAALSPLPVARPASLLNPAVTPISGNTTVAGNSTVPLSPVAPVTPPSPVTPPQPWRGANPSPSAGRETVKFGNKEKGKKSKMGIVGWGIVAAAAVLSFMFDWYLSFFFASTFQTLSHRVIIGFSVLMFIAAVVCLLLWLKKRQSAGLKTAAISNAAGLFVGLSGLVITPDVNYVSWHEVGYVIGNDITMYSKFGTYLGDYDLVFPVIAKNDIQHEPWMGDDSAVRNLIAQIEYVGVRVRGTLLDVVFQNREGTVLMWLTMEKERTYDAISLKEFLGRKFIDDSGRWYGVGYHLNELPTDEYYKLLNVALREQGVITIPSNEQFDEFVEAAAEAAPAAAK